MNDYLHVGVKVPDMTVAAQRLLAMGYHIFSDGLGGKVPVDPDHLEEQAFKVEDPDGITVDVSEADSIWPGADLPNPRPASSFQRKDYLRNDDQ